MKNILIFGAGKSATCLIEYLCKTCEEHSWRLIVCDSDLATAQSKINQCMNARAISIQVSDQPKRVELIKEADLVISMLPPHLHYFVAKDCLLYSKHLLTASYIDEKIKNLENEIKQKGILFLCETGLDPGIDHLSAMRIIDGIKKKRGKILSFKSHCGGLISPESDDNPWHYKITWNPANIVSAGSSGAVFKENGKIMAIPYRDVFSNCKEVHVPGLSQLAWYPNRDSLAYIKTYGLEEAQTFIRTTLRHPVFCRGWNVMVNMGFTNWDDHEEIKNCKTYYEWFLEKNKDMTAPLPIIEDETEFNSLIDYLGLRSNKLIEIQKSNSAAMLQNILEKRLGMKPYDKDMIVMFHEIGFEIDGKKNEIKSSLTVKGEDQIRTAMAKTVGLPIGIAAKLILLDKIKLTGLHIPVVPEIYEPVLDELQTNAIKFKEELN